MKVITDLEDLKGKTIKEAVNGLSEPARIGLYFTDNTYCLLEIDDYGDINLIDTKNLSIVELKWLKFISEEEYEKRIKTQEIADYCKLEKQERLELRRLKAKYEK